MSGLWRISKSRGTVRENRTGFTLVELLVVIAIIGVLVALLLPAVQAARETARRAQCTNNLKQLGLAVLNYESAYRIFPPASHWRVSAGATPRTANQTKFSENWVIMVLPFFDQQTLYDSFNLTQYIGAAANAKARGTVLSVMKCPTDIFNEQPFNGSAAPRTASVGDGWARGNYGVNAGTGLQNTKTECYYVHGISMCAAFPDSPGWQSRWIRGVMGCNSSLRVKQIADGLSHTMLIGELRSGIDPVDPRGCWAMSGAASSLWGFGTYWYDMTGPNPGTWGADNMSTCKEIADKFGEPKLYQLGMHCFDPAGGYDHFNQTAAKSMHEGGIQACLGDGSVQFINDFIDTVGNWDASPPQLPVWDRLIISSDGQTIGEL
jgi:prepilin-type N-terminal cleavage/methylation domain-containing protein